MKRLVGVLVMVVSVAGCNAHGLGDASSQVDCIPVGARIDPVATTLHVGDSTRLVLLPAPPCPSDRRSGQLAFATWSSSDSLVARVNAINGTVRALALGRVTITAADRRDVVTKSAAIVTVVP